MLGYSIKKMIKPFWILFFAFLELGISTHTSHDEFEAAFQGKCGTSSPCAQVCLELHDGTFECQCRDGYRLHQDGYSCFVANASEESESSESFELHQPNMRLNTINKSNMLPKLGDVMKKYERDIYNNYPFKRYNILNTHFYDKQQQQESNDTHFQPYNRIQHEEEESEDGEHDDTPSNEMDDIMNTEQARSAFAIPQPYNSQNIPPTIQSHNPEQHIPTQTDTSILFQTKSNFFISTSSPDENDLKDIEHSDEYFSSEEYFSDENSPFIQSSSGSGGWSKMRDMMDDKLDSDLNDQVPNESKDNINNINGYFVKDVEEGYQRDSGLTLSNSLGYKTNDEVVKSSSNLNQVSSCPLNCQHGVCSKESSQLDHQIHDTYRCLCYLGYKGTLCDSEEEGEEGFNSGLFRGESWIAFPVLHDAYMTDQISLEFRAESPNGILLLTGERDDLTGDFLTLYILDGFLQFRFDCGSGSGVVKSSKPISLHKWNKATIIRRRWDGWMQVNNGPFTQGRSKGLFSRITFRQPVFVGGSGNITWSAFKSRLESSDDEMNIGLDTSKNITMRKSKVTVTSSYSSQNNARTNDSNGFRGCIRNFVINDRPYRFGLEPAGDALQGFDLESCNDEKACDLISCQHGGQCITQKDEYPTCLCPLGYTGPLCETPLDLQIPMFNGSSYLKYEGLGVTRVLSWLELEIVIKPDAMDGLIMYNGYRTDGMGDFIALSIDQGYLEFAMDLGTGTAIIRSESQVALGEWHHVLVSRTSRLISLRIDNQPPLMALTPGAFTQLTLPDNLFLGGIPEAQWLSPKVKIHSGFSGCIQKLIINEKPLKIMGAAMAGVNLENCAHPCLRNPCGHGGQCIPQLDTFRCHCPLGFRDPYCETVMDKEDHMAAPKFIGDSYLYFTHPSIISRISGSKLDISFQVKTTLSRGLILWAGRKRMTSASDFLCIGLHNGFVVASFSLGSGQATIAYNYTSVHDGRWHHVHFVRNEQEASLSINSGTPVSGVAPGKLRQLNINDGLYLGGLEDARHQSLNKYSEGLMGCLSDLILDSDFRVPLLQKATRGRNVDYCD